MDYFVFLCHNSDDKNFVEKINKSLNKGSSSIISKLPIKSWIDNEMKAGDEFNKEINTQISKSDYCLIFLSVNGIGNYQIVELLRIKDRHENFSNPPIVIPVLMPNIESTKDVPMPSDIEKVKKSLYQNYLRAKDDTLIDDEYIQSLFDELQQFLAKHHWIKVHQVDKFLPQLRFIPQLKKIIKDGIKKSIDTKLKFTNHDKYKLMFISIPVILAALILSKIFPSTSTTTSNSQPSSTNSNSPISNKKPNYVIQLKYSRAGDFSSGLAPVEEEGSTGYINKSDQIVIKRIYDAGLSFSKDASLSKKNNLAMIWKANDNRGYIDKGGKTIISTQYAVRNAASFFEGKARVCVASKCYYINTNNKEVFPEHYFTGAGNFSEGLAPVRVKEKWGYINESGEIAITEQFDQAFSFSEGLAPVFVRGKWIYINRDGKTKFETEYDWVSNFSQGLAAVKKGNKWGYINDNNTLVIPLSFDNPKKLDPIKTYICDVAVNDNGTKCNNLDDRYDFSENLAAIYKNGKWGYINKNGEMVIDLYYDKASKFSERLAAVCENDDNRMKCGYIKNPIEKPSYKIKSSKGYAKLRTEPRTDNNVFKQLYNNTSVIFLDEYKDNYGEIWYKVKVEANNQIGWVNSNLVD